MATPAPSCHALTTSGFSGSPAAQAWRSAGSGRSSASFAIERYSVGDMQSTFTPSRSTQLEPPVRIEARVVQQRGRPAQPRGHERVAR